MKTSLSETGPFNRIARETITNPHLSLKAKGLLTLILGFPEDWEFSIAGLQPFLREGRESIMSALRELSDNGHVIKIVRRSDDGRFCRYDYTFYDLPQKGVPITEEPSSDCPRLEYPLKDVPEQLRSNESSPNSNKKERIKVLMSYDHFVNVWEKLKATPKWLKKSPAEIDVELECLADYTPGEATALVKASLANKWGNAVYDRSSKKILEDYHKKHTAMITTINPPKPQEPEISEEEKEQMNRDALISMSNNYYREVREKGHILSSIDLPVASVFDFLLSSRAIKVEPKKLEPIGKLTTDKERYAAKRKLLEETFIDMISRGEALTMPS